ncbi:alpha/beta fold hydrolase [Streptomyces olivoverticillatus]|uniref:thioesterase II family protein n=1 Tax=Streptomyces olivoverticillatus TaxID=66427 RepID=UPI001611D5B5
MLVHDSAWLLGAGDHPDPAARIFCFAHAGGNPRTFLGWQDALGDEAQIVAMCPPGRGHRYKEAAPSGMAEFADSAAEAIAAAADRPVLLFGHSFGAVMAFEVARRLGDLPQLRRLIASGCSAPSLLPTQRVVDTAKLEGREFTEAVQFFGGLPPEVVANEDLQELLLPALRADFRMVADYRYRPAAPLTVPVSLVNGREDPHIKEAGLRPWQQECAGESAYHWAEGGHFYFDDRPEAVTDVLRSAVRDAPRTPPRAAEHVEMI